MNPWIYKSMKRTCSLETVFLNLWSPTTVQLKVNEAIWLCSLLPPFSIRDSKGLIYSFIFSISTKDYQFWRYGLPNQIVSWILFWRRDTGVVFGRSVNPIQTRDADYPTTLIPPPIFLNGAASLTKDWFLESDPIIWFWNSLPQMEIR